MEVISRVDLNNLNSEFMFYIRLAYQVDYNIYYNHYKDNLNEEVEKFLLDKKEEYELKISNIGERNSSNSDKFIILTDNKLLGYIKYHQLDSINVDSVYGENEEIIKKLLNELLKDKNIRFNNTMCNMDLNNILKELARTITIEDFEKDPDLLTKLTREQLVEVSEAIKNKQSMDDYKVDTSEDTNPNLGKEIAGIQKRMTNGHSILEDDRKKQGFVDALVLSLLSGFTAGIFTTLLVIFIKLKTGI